MIISHTTTEAINQAFNQTNVKYKGNLRINVESVSKTQFKVNLRVIDSKREGTHLSYSGRRTTNACWHVHGEFFDALLKTDPNAQIYSSYAPINKIYSDNGTIKNNWQDWNMGSQLSPLKASTACMCNKRLLTLGKTRIILSIQ